MCWQFGLLWECIHVLFIVSAIVLFYILPQLHVLFCLFVCLFYENYLPFTHTHTQFNSIVGKDTPVTQVQNFLKATSLNDVSLLSDESLLCPEGEISESSTSQASRETKPAQLWKDIDQAESHDPLFSAEYAPEIYAYMRKREVSCIIYSVIVTSMLNVVHNSFICVSVKIIALSSAWLSYNT